MSRMGTITCIMALLAGSAGAALLVEETFDYGVGSASSTWNGGTGFSSTAWSPGTTGTTLDNGLTLGGMQVAGGSAHIQYTATTSFSAGTLGRSLNTSSVTSGDLWMAYLYQFDTVRSTIADDEWLEIRPNLNIRTAIDEGTSAVELRYGTDYSASVADPNVKNGTTLLIVAKFADMGSATGADAKGWAMTASEYDDMLVNGGVSEANLDSYAGIQLSNSFAADVTMAGNVTLSILPIGRNSTPSFYVDELRLGTTVTDVVAIPEPATLGLVCLVGGGLAMLRRLVI